MGYDYNWPRQNAVATHKLICQSYRTGGTLPVSTMLRAAQAAQDGGDQRLQQQAEDDDQDESQCIFHNLKLISFPFVPTLPDSGMRIFFCFGKASPER